MDANQRSEVNNQTNNVANEKWTPGSKGKTADDGPLDHTYPQGLGAQQQGNQGIDTMGTQQSGAGPGAQPGGMGGREDGGNQSQTPGGSMQTQMSGGSGAVQGITDSHQRQMEQKSGAYGLLEQPIGHRSHDSGVNVTEGHDMHRDVVRGQMGSQNPNQPDLQGGSLGPNHGTGSMQSASQGGTSGGGMHGPQSAPTSLNAGSATGNRQQGSSLYVSDNSTRNGGGMRGPLSGSQGNGQEAQRGNTQLGVSGSGSMANQAASIGGVHESNDAAGGLPRSPGNSGARNAAGSTDRAGSQTGAGAAEGGPPAHESNDAAGGYPRSPGYANKLSGDQNMDDDTGFKRKP
ncbi:hypothetical protein SRABI118_02550 [Massilia sp. Bi118]|uniref:hypothetical protein n=1 Tax=Massilia sp. Bi118 TaxID=2822346 RepID=UPI001D20459B|nr:hypothetical protein [Massilia sp. Bi118]CAH0234288.1 hypothetical protein SRABI118_02550 [Massilia sp. Bi118]